MKIVTSIPYFLFTLCVNLGFGGPLIENNFNSDSTGFTLGTGSSLDTATESAFTGAVPGGSINLLDGSETTNPDLVSDAINPDLPFESLVISFDYYSVGRGGENHSFEVKSSTEQAVLLDMNSNGAIRYREGTSGSNSFVELAPANTILNDTWYAFTLTFPPEAGSGKTIAIQVTEFSQPVGGILEVTGLPFRNDISDYETARWFMNVAPVTFGAEYQIDNVSIRTEPFPGTLIANDFNSDATGFTRGTGTSLDATNESNFTAASPGGSIKLLDTSSETNPDLISDAIDPANTVSPLVISFDYRLNTIGAANHTFELTSPTVQGMIMDMMSGQKIRHNPGAGWVDLIDGTTTETKIQFNVWYNFTLTFSPQSAETKTWDIVVTEAGQPVGSKLVATGLPFRNNINVYEFARWFMNVSPSTNAGADYNIDNVFIRTLSGPPAPAAEVEIIANPDGSLTIPFTGILQSSPDLSSGTWADLDPQPTSPHTQSALSPGAKVFFRSRD